MKELPLIGPVRNEKEFSFQCSKYSCLALGELEAGTCSTLAELFPLHHAWVACQQSSLLQRSAMTQVEITKGACQAMPKSTRLSRFSTPFDRGLDVITAIGLSDIEWLADNHGKDRSAKVLIGIHSIHRDLSAAWFDENTRRSGLAASGSVVVLSNRHDSRSPRLKLKR